MTAISFVCFGGRCSSSSKMPASELHGQMKWLRFEADRRYTSLYVGSQPSKTMFYGNAERKIQNLYNI